MDHIASRQNQEIKQVAKLHTSKERYIQKKFIAEGIRVCSTLLAHGYTLVKLYVTEKMRTTAHAITSAENITLVNNPVMQKISTAKTPSGIVGIFVMPEQLAPNILSATLGGLVLADISNPGNMGTLFRSAAAMNVKTVVIINGVDPFSPKVIQASAGTIAQLTLFQISWHDLVVHKGKVPLCALVVSGGNNTDEIDIKNSLLVVGNEAHGIPEQWLADCEQKLTLPMPGNTESLNVTIAGSIALYIATQQ